jgi:hypothetical protein
VGYFFSAMEAHNVARAEQVKLAATLAEKSGPLPYQGLKAAE